MEGGFEQLIFVAVFLLVGLIDLFVRWLKKKTRQVPPREIEQEPVLEEEHEAELLERQPVKSAPQVPPAPSWWEQPSPAPSRPHVLPPRPPRPPPQPASRPRARKRWVKNPTDARHGIILMTVLGRCRGLDAQDRPGS